jgi:hypothetical protein
MQHLRTLRRLNLVAAAFFAVVGLLVLTLFLLPLGDIDIELPLLRIRLVGLLSSLLLLGLAATHLVVGYLVGAQRGRIFQTFLALVHVMSFPLGTAYAGYALYLCWVNESTRRAFASAIKPYVS